MNKFNFQGAAIGAVDVSVGFGTTLSCGSTWVAPQQRPANCEVRALHDRRMPHGRGIAPYFMQVLGFGQTTVSSLATATLSPAQSNCAGADGAVHARRAAELRLHAGRLGVDELQPVGRQRQLHRQLPLDRLRPQCAHSRLLGWRRRRSSPA
jgi:hypothetical protein